MGIDFCKGYTDIYMRGRKRLFTSEQFMLDNVKNESCSKMIDILITNIKNVLRV